MIRNSFWLIIIVLYGFQAYCYRNVIHTIDGIAYLDIAYQFGKGHYLELINSCSCPMYPFVLGLVFKIFNVGIFDSGLVLKAINFLIIIILFNAYQKLIDTILAVNKEPANDHFNGNNNLLPLAVLLFILINYPLSGVNFDTPDNLMFIFLVFNITLLYKIKNGKTDLKTFLYLGIFCGLGYLTKTIFLILSIFFIVAAFIYSRKILNTIITTAVFLIIAIPYIVLLSEKYHHITIGDVGKETFMQCVTGKYAYPYDKIKFPELTDAPKILNDEPRVYFFDSKLNVTDPIWYDRTAWSKGAQLDIFAEHNFRVYFANLFYLINLFGGSIILSYIYAKLVFKANIINLGKLKENLVLITPGLMIIIMCFLGANIMYPFESRLTANASILVFLTYLIVIEVKKISNYRKYFNIIILITILQLFMSFTKQIYIDWLFNNLFSPSSDKIVAKYLNSLNINNFDQIGLLGFEQIDDLYLKNNLQFNISRNYYFAFLDNLKITAIITDAKAFLNLTSQQKAVIYQKLKSAGLKAIVLTDPYIKVINDCDWQKIPQTNTYIKLLNN